MIIQQIELLVQHPEEAVVWLENRLFFLPCSTGIAGVDGILLKNGNCILKLCKAEEPLFSENSDKFTGLAHIALAACDIGQALLYCKEQQMDLQLTPSGSYFHNPNIWGSGTDYFNIHSPFGVTFEVCRRSDLPSVGTQPLIADIEHIGFPVSKFDSAVSFFCRIGGKIAASPVHQNTENGYLTCAMLLLGGKLLEIYCFSDIEHKPLENQPLHTLQVHCSDSIWDIINVSVFKTYFSRIIY